MIYSDAMLTPLEDRASELHYLEEKLSAFDVSSEWVHIEIEGDPQYSDVFSVWFYFLR
jgi:hypothetical protein